jgi:UDP-glucose 4-epimerase
MSTGKQGILAEMIKHKNIKFVFGDLRSREHVNEVCKNKDKVFHLAALTLVPESVQKPLIYHDVNTTGTLNLLEASRQNNVNHLVFFSSASVYGNSDRVPLSEHEKAEPLSPYGYSKLMSEKYCEYYSKMYGMKITILRPFNVYGDGANDGIIKIFLEHYKDKKTPVIYGNGNQTRDFIHVSDVVKAAISIDKNGIFNVATGKNTSLKQIIEQMSLTPIYAPAKPEDILHSLADVSNLKSTGFSPSVELSDFINKKCGDLK